MNDKLFKKPFTLGHPLHGKTFNVNMIYDANEITVCELYNIPINSTREDIEKSPNFTEMYKERLEQADRIVKALNESF